MKVKDQKKTFETIWQDSMVLLKGLCSTNCIRNQYYVGAIASCVHFRIDCSLQEDLHNTPYAVTVSRSQLCVPNSLPKKPFKLSGQSARVLSYFQANE